MLFIQYDAFSTQPGLFQPAQHRFVPTTNRSEAYRGHAFEKIGRVSAGKQTEPGFSRILAEEESAILARLQTA